MKKRYAVIDLGTNTFHLIVAEKDETGTFNKLYRKRLFVKLAENGIQTIGQEPFKRGLEAISMFKDLIDEFQVSTVKAFGTAALRTANNGQDFIKQILSKTGIEVQLISGNREAELIYKGVIQAVEFKGTALIMDIGGGSVEFIIADKTGIRWAQSFPVGVAVLHNNFHKSEPVSLENIFQLNNHLKSTLAPLVEILNLYSPSTIIGASGTFDVLETILCKEKPSDFHGVIAVKDFPPFYKTLLEANLQERLEMPQIPDSRAELIVVALILIDFVLKQSKIQTISVSAYAMKEGMLKELIEADL